MDRPLKRQYQPSIASFFHPLNHSEGNVRAQSASVAVEPSVQASLLNVGMRVRKAVPEGYKRSTINIKTLQEEQPFQSIVTPNISTRAAELAPFCGLHKIGGYAPQQDSFLGQCDTNQGLLYIEEDDGFPLSSQESWVSSVSNDSVCVLPYQSSVMPRKHSREEDDEIVQEIQNAIIGVQMQTAAFGRDVVMSARRIAQPTSRKQRANLLRTATGNFTMVVGQDFEDADFLTPVSPSADDIDMDNDW